MINRSKKHKQNHSFGNSPRSEVDPGFFERGMYKGTNCLREGGIPTDNY